MKQRTFISAALVAAALGQAAVQAPVAGAGQRLDVSATVRLLPGGGATLRQQGSFSGTPLGAGSLSVSTDVGRGHGAVVRFKMANRHGRVWGSGDVRVNFHGSTVVYEGSARITGGDGAFRRIRGHGLHVSGRGALTGSRFAVHLAGPITT